MPIPSFKQYLIKEEETPITTLYIGRYSVEQDDIVERGWVPSKHLRVTVVNKDILNAFIKFVQSEFDPAQLKDVFEAQAALIKKLEVLPECFITHDYIQVHINMTEASEIYDAVKRSGGNILRVLNIVFKKYGINFVFMQKKSDIYHLVYGGVVRDEYNKALDTYLLQKKQHL